MTTLTQTLTLQQFAELPERDGREEFDRGEVIFMPPAKSLHAKTIRRIRRLLESLPGLSGYAVLVQDGFLLTRESGGIVRIPDLAVVPVETIIRTPDDEWFSGAPYLAVEVASPSNTAPDLEEKIAQYLEYGGHAVWVVYPKARRVYVYGRQERRMVVSVVEADGPLRFGGETIAAADFFVSDDV